MGREHCSCCFFPQPQRNKVRERTSLATPDIQLRSPCLCSLLVSRKKIIWLKKSPWFTWLCKAGLHVQRAKREPSADSFMQYVEMCSLHGLKTTQIQVQTGQHLRLNAMEMASQQVWIFNRHGVFECIFSLVSRGNKYTWSCNTPTNLKAINFESTKNVYGLEQAVEYVGKKARGLKMQQERQRLHERKCSSRGTICP